MTIAPRICARSSGSMRTRSSNTWTRQARGTAKETVNGLLDAEHDDMCSAQRCAHSRSHTSAAHYTRKLHTKAVEVEVKMPKPGKQTIETAIIERYRRRDLSIEETIVQMCLAGVPARQAGLRTSPRHRGIIQKESQRHMNKPVISTRNGQPRSIAVCVDQRQLSHRLSTRSSAQSHVSRLLQ